MPSDPFVGKWEMIPAENNYQHGAPPISGTYIIDHDGSSYRIAMRWTTVDSQQFEMAYTSIPDGIDYPYEGNPAIDTVSMTRVDEYTLDSTTKKDGQIVNHGRRVLSENGRLMTITQSGTRPDGQPYSNISVYAKQGS